MTRRIWYPLDHDYNDVPLFERPVCLTKDAATPLFGNWTSDWADSGRDLDHDYEDVEEFEA